MIQVLRHLFRARWFVFRFSFDKKPSASPIHAPGESIIKINEIIKHRWQIVLIIATIIALARMLGNTLYDYGTYPPINRDAVLYQYEGWLITQGRVLYVDLWELKPPLAAETPAILAVISGDDMLLLHWLNLALVCVMVIGSVWLVGQLVYDDTHNAEAAIVAGLALLTLTFFTRLGALGFRPKYLTLFFGLLSIVLADRDHPFWSGVCLALSAGHWQPGAFFIPVAGWQMFRKHGLRHAWVPRMILGAALVTFLAVLPNIIDGSLNTMFDQVVKVNFEQPNQKFGLTRAIEKVVELVRFALVVWIWGTLGIIWSLTRLQAKRGWLVIGFVLFAVQVVEIDFDSTPDLFVIMSFVAMGTGMWFADIMSGDVRSHAPQAAVVIGGVAVLIVAWLIWQYTRVGHRHPGAVVASTLALVPLAGLIWREKLVRIGIILVLGLTLILSVGLMDTDGLVYKERQPIRLSDPFVESSEERLGMPSLAYMYWHRVMPPGCHILLSTTELRYMQKKGQTLESDCR